MVKKVAKRKDDVQVVRGRLFHIEISVAKAQPRLINDVNNAFFQKLRFLKNLRLLYAISFAGLAINISIIVIFEV